MEGKTIFDFATSELTQDAVIATILDRKDDIAKSFLIDMFKQAKQKKTLPIKNKENFEILSVKRSMKA